MNVVGAHNAAEGQLVYTRYGVVKRRVVEWKRRRNLGNGAATGAKRTGNVRTRRARLAPLWLAPEQLAGSVAEVGSSDDALVAIDAQTREGVKEA